MEAQARERGAEANVARGYSHGGVRRHARAVCYITFITECNKQGRTFPR